MTGKTLKDIKVGHSGVVTEINAVGAIKRHLIDMGITPGVTVYVRKMAPMGDPIEINLRGYELTLRKDEAAKIGIE